MSKTLKVILVIAAVLFAVGIVLIGIALVSGAGLSDVANFQFPFSAGAPSSAGDYSSAGSYAVPAGDVSSVQVNWSSGKVNVLSGTGTEIVFEEFSNRAISEEEALRWRMEGRTLIIDFAKRKVVNCSKSLTLTLPEALRDELEIDVASAEVNVREIEAGSVNIDGASGKVWVEDTVTCRSLEIETASGDVHAAGSYDELDLNSASGRLTFAGSIREGDVESSSGAVNLTLTENFRELDVETSSGEVTVSFPESVGFWLDYETASGEVKTDLPMTLQGKRWQMGTPTGNLSVETSSGNLNLVRPE